MCGAARSSRHAGLQLLSAYLPYVQGGQVESERRWQKIRTERILAYAGDVQSKTPRVARVRSSKLCRLSKLSPQAQVYLYPLPLCVKAALKMSSEDQAVSEDSFEFIETPAAPTPAPQAQDYGVRTTTVSFAICCLAGEARACTDAHWNSIQQSRMAQSQPTVPAAIPSTISSFSHS